ncbi:hypothetical protein QUF75_09965 [Desulfococcaceae bacterium HSG7]|nr:hypothetical protein [Desulfococcaceae bacterium HSG7]
MSFDINFFNELSTLTPATIAPITPQAYRASVEELYLNSRVSRDFFMTTVEFVKKLYQKSNHRYHFAIGFRVYPEHICNFSKGKAFRKQFNVGFSAGNNESEHCARIGLGFSLNRSEKQAGIDDYLNFLQDVRLNPKKFDYTFSQWGNYGEPINIFSPTASSTLVLNDTPNYNDDWRFYGKLLCLKDNYAILSSVDNFVDEAIKVFNHIRNSGYY